MYTHILIPLMFLMLGLDPPLRSPMPAMCAGPGEPELSIYLSISLSLSLYIYIYTQYYTIIIITPNHILSVAPAGGWVRGAGLNFDVRIKICFHK